MRFGNPEHIDVVRYLTEMGANIRILDDCALKMATYRIHFSGANIHANNDDAVKASHS